MQLKVRAFPPAMTYPNEFLINPGPAARYAEEVVGNMGPREFRLQNEEEIRAYAQKVKMKGLGTNILFSVLGLLLGGGLVLLLGSSGAEDLAVGIGSTAILGVGFLVLRIIQDLASKTTIYPTIVLRKGSISFVNNSGYDTDPFLFDQAGPLRVRKVGKKRFLVFMDKENPKRIAAESPAFVWEAETESILESFVGEVQQ